ncbi:MAG: gene transfer agent family protein [Phyllobacterium sp.]
MVDGTAEHYAKINQPFGDGHYDFCLDWDSAVNWESKTERSLYSTFVQMQRSGYFILSDIREVIRLALIGGGMAPVPALKLVEAYVDKRPLAENITLAMLIMEKAFFGDDEAGKEQARGPKQ